MGRKFYSIHNQTAESQTAEYGSNTRKINTELKLWFEFKLVENPNKIFTEKEEIEIENKIRIAVLSAETQLNKENFRIHATEINKRR